MELRFAVLHRPAFGQWRALTIASRKDMRADKPEGCLWQVCQKTITLRGTAFELYERMEHKKAAEEHRQLSCATIMKLANSMPTDEPLRGIFLSAPAIRRILADEEASANPA